MKNSFSRSIAAGLLALPAICSASLVDRGGGLLYDDVLNVTWLKDANYAKTTGYDADGLMTWSSAMAWASDLTYYDSVRKVSYDDWRLPSVAPIGNKFIYDYRYDGTSDQGYGITSPNSELAHLWSVSLGNLGYCGPGSDYYTIGCVHQDGGGLHNSGPFENLQGYPYWSGSRYDNLSIWVFRAFIGSQEGLPEFLSLYALAVRDGDVGIGSQVPEPGTSALLIAAMTGLLGSRQRQHRI